MAHQTTHQSGKRSATRSLETQADAWKAFALARGARFNVERKASQSVEFSQHARSLGIATKLVDVSSDPVQCNLDTLRLHRIDAQHGELTAVVEDGEIWLTWMGFFLGKIQSKHLPWLLPLLCTRQVRFYALKVTGGTKDKPTLGLNIAIAGTARAIEAKQRGYGFRVREKAVATA